MTRTKLWRSSCWQDAGQSPIGARTLVACALGVVIGVAGFPRPGFAQRGVTVTGFIENPTGIFVSYATCTLMDHTSKDSRVAVADTLGRFTFQNIVPGSYLIETKAHGYAPREVALTVSTKPISGLRIVLKPGEEAAVSNEPEVPTATPTAQIPTPPGTQGLPPQPQPLPVTERLPRLWSVGFGITNSYDTNVDHDQSNVGAYGLAYGTTIAFRSAQVRPLFQVAYDLTRYTVPNAPQWTRLSHRFRGIVERRLNRRVYFDVAGDVNSGGASEDREIVNQYLVRPRVEFRLPRDHRLRVYSAYRLKRYSANELRNATNLYTGLELQRRLESGDRWLIGYRYEENRATGPRYMYRRLTYETEYTTQVTKTDVISFNVVFRSQRYPNRMAELNDVDVPRHNQRWIPVLSWGHRIGEHVEARLDYAFENQASNDMDEEYTAQNLGFSFGFTW